MDENTNLISDAKIYSGLQLVKALYRDDMDGVLEIVTTYLFSTGLTVKSESVARFAEDGLIRCENPIREDRKPFNDN